MAPLLSEFPYSMADARFISSPIDFVVFDGYTEAKNNGDSEICVVLMEIKMGPGD